MGKAVMGGQKEMRCQRSNRAKVTGDGERTYKKTGVLAAMTVIVDMLAALLCVSESKGTTLDPFCLTLILKSFQTEEARNAIQQLRSGTGE